MPYICFQALGSHGNSAVEVDRDTAERMGRIQASYRGNRETVLGDLLRHVCDIQPEFHANYRVAGWGAGATSQSRDQRAGANRRDMDVSNITFVSFDQSRNLFSLVCFSFWLKQTKFS